MVDSQPSLKDMIKDIPEYAVLFAVSAVLALSVVIATGPKGGEEDDENDQNYTDDLNLSTPYGLGANGGVYSPKSSTFNKQSSTSSYNSSFGELKKNGSFGSTNSSFGGSPTPSQYGMSKMNSGIGVTSASPSTYDQSPLKGSTMSGNGAGSGCTQTSKGGSLGSKT